MVRVALLPGSTPAFQSQLWTNWEEPGDKLASSPGHSQILSRSRGEKIWEWPGEEPGDKPSLIHC